MSANKMNTVVVKEKMKKQAGVALLEMLIVIGIIGLLTAGVVVLSTSTFSSLDELKVVNNMSTVKTKLQKVFKQQGNYAGLSNATSVDFLADNDLANPYGVNIQLATAVTNGQTDGGFTMSVGGLSEASCVNVMSTLDGNSFDFVGLITGAAGTAATPLVSTSDIAGDVTEVDPEYVAGASVVKALTVINITADCKVAAANNNAILVTGAY